MSGVDHTLASGGGGSGTLMSTPPLPGRAIPLLPHQLCNDFHIRLQGLLPPDGRMAIHLQPTRRRAGTAPSPPATAPPSSSDSNERDSVPPPEAGDRLPEEVVTRFLETMASDGGEHGPCAVCLDDLHGEDRTVGILRCRHIFHGDCIGKWLRRKNVCPLCRAIVV